jgi:hypothetical protein
MMGRKGVGSEERSREGEESMVRCSKVKSCVRQSSAVHYDVSTVQYTMM